MAAAAVVGDAMFVLCGEMDMLYSTAEVFNFTTGNWTTVPLPSGIGRSAPLVAANSMARLFPSYHARWDLQRHIIALG